MISFLSIPPELLIEVLLNVEEPWAIHHTNRLLLTISEDEHYLYLRDIRLPPSLVIWNAIRRRGVGLSPEYLQRLIDGGALVPFSFAQLLTNPRIPRPAPARALHKLLQSLKPMTRALLVGTHMKPITAALTHDDDQRVFEALFGAPTVRNVRGAAKVLFDHRAFVPYSLGDETDVGSLHGAFTSALESYAKGNESPLDALLESETVCTLVKTDERDLKSHVLVEAFAIAGSELGSRLLRHDAFWRPRVNIVEALLRLNSSEAGLARFMEIATTRSTPFPPANGRMSGLDYTPEVIVRALSSKLSQKISPEWFIKHHKSLGRIYSYFTSSNPSLCDQLDSLARITLENVFRPSTVSGHHDSSMLWSFYSQFGGSTKENIVREVRGKVKELVYGNPYPPYTFPEWGACLHLIMQLDLEAREKMLSGLINPSYIGNTQAQTIEVGLAADEEGALWLGEAKKRMQRFGIPLVMFGLA